MIDLSILIASYNTRRHTLACLGSLYEQMSGSDIRFEVIVVDNRSSDGSDDAIARQFPQVRLIRSNQNLGFARANNVAAEASAGQFLLLLNPDTIVLPGAIQNLLSFARARGGQVIVGGRTLFADGSLNPASCHGRPTLWSLFCAASGLMSLFRDSRLFDPEALGGWRRDSVREVDIVSGCFLLLHRSLWDRLGGFDPQFFMYGEDADLCLRAAAMGARCVICPDACIIHHGGASEPAREDKMVRLFQAKARLFRRHWPAWRAAVGIAALDAWALSRTLAFGTLCLLGASRRAQLHAWRRILQRRAQWHEPIGCEPDTLPASASAPLSEPGT
ncbi:glycosyltransferase family 2 protein [Fontivita pretiosa]|uniref:glycosyltransferase family 2 protein n=1 Tax=Fontivita pretiosa TaxID=2989684 RepID=UPI003D16E03A